MQYSPKLKRALEQIKKIVDDNDIAALVFLHTPGYGEYLVKVDPSYSVAKIEGDQLRVKAKLKEDFNGDKEAWVRKTTDTSNMLMVFSETCGPAIHVIMQMSQELDKRIDAEHDGAGHTSHTSQNN